jgi:hypothetical protein
MLETCWACGKIAEKAMGLLEKKVETYLGLLKNC